MKLYHGGAVEIQKPDLIYSRISLDFGRGFYTTSSKEQAIRFAKNLARRTKQTPIVSTYEFAVHEFSALRTKEFEEDISGWFDYVVFHRTNKEELPTDYDIVIGPVADDQVATTLGLFQSQIVTKDIAIQLLKYWKLTDQFVFKTKEGLAKLHFIESEVVSDE